MLQKTGPPHAVATAEIRDGAGPTSKETPANATQADGLWVSQPPFRENKNSQTNPIKKKIKIHTIKTDLTVKETGLSAANPG